MPLFTITALLSIIILIFVYYYRKGYKEVKELRNLAFQKEKALNYSEAAKIWEELGEIKEAARIRKIIAEQSKIKVDQTVVQGDQITKTEIKDSVLNRSNIGAGSDDKIAKLEKIANLKKEGLIDDAEFKQMKKEILSK
jgi:hypothetical protein